MWSPRRKPGKAAKDSRKRWDEGVRSVLAGESSHGLRNAFATLHGVGRAEPTHEVRGKPRVFDHMFVSRHFTVEACEYEHGWRKRKLSDHSAIWARLG